MATKAVKKRVRPESIAVVKPRVEAEVLSANKQQKAIEKAVQFVNKRVHECPNAMIARTTKEGGKSEILPGNGLQ